MNVLALIVEVDVMWWVKAAAMVLLGAGVSAIATVWLIFKDWKFW
jgi:hypothetical protein